MSRRVCVCAFVCACVRACVRACVCVCVQHSANLLQLQSNKKNLLILSRLLQLPVCLTRLVLCLLDAQSKQRNPHA